MSASLVGSEMCIRDSEFRAAAHRPVFSTASLNTAGRPTAQPTHSAGPVSYTHLTLPTICSV
eukprot:8633275-Alexandrium_andersonii.AAC.1